MRNMTQRRARAARLAVTLAALLSLTAAIGVASGAIPSSSGKIYGCFATSDGKLRVIDKAKQQQCKSTERALNWNQQGLPGPPGPQGDPGPQGAKGDPGPAAALQLVTRRQSQTLQAGETTSVRSGCLPGERVVSGGYVVVNTLVGVTQSFPLEDGSGWTVRYDNDRTAPSEVITFARCAAG